jgi:hypothetical protein
VGRFCCSSAEASHRRHFIARKYLYIMRLEPQWPYFLPITTSMSPLTIDFRTSLCRKRPPRFGGARAPFRQSHESMTSLLRASPFPSPAQRSIVRAPAGSDAEVPAPQRTVRLSAGPLHADTGDRVFPRALGDDVVCPEVR